ncbi:DUF4232 domain-containing protein [Streptomyces sp. NPDC086783]|uniref:DUF4232 domain-containing protein n=1 Tax=Streptomyces sp. NPDC086783 TaxID=3365758 RepID=UPI0038115297
MRALPIAVTVLTAALTLTACDDGGAGDDTDAKPSAASGTCTADHVGIEVGPGNAAPAAGDTGNIPVTVTNRGPADCTLRGFPRVDLLGGSDSWTVAAQEGANPVQVKLKRDEAATFTITYARGPEGDSAKSADAKKVQIGLPGSDAAQSFPWTYGPVALKGGSAPDASVSPFQTAGD